MEAHSSVPKVGRMIFASEVFNGQLNCLQFFPHPVLSFSTDVRGYKENMHMYTHF